jgi:hypothetical protein
MVWSEQLWHDWSHKLKFYIWVRSDSWLLIYSSLCFLRPSWKLVRTGQWLMIYSTFRKLRMSSIRVHPHLKQSLSLFWSPQPKFQISIRSDEWLLSYNPFTRRWLRRICGGGGAGYVVVVAQDMWCWWHRICGGWLVKSDYITTPSAIL